MFGTFRRHQQWLWIFIATITIISFVYFFSPDAKWGTGAMRAASKGDFGSYNNHAVEREEMITMLREAKLNHFMRSGGREWPNTDETGNRNLQRDALSRLFILDRIKDLGISVSDAAIARSTRERLGDYPVDKFEHDYLAPQGLNADDLERYMRHETQIQQLVGVASASAKLLTPREAEILFRKENEQVATEVVGFWATNYLSKVEVKPDALATYYTNNIPRYRVPDRIQVSYVDFNASNFLAEADKELAKSTNFDTYIAEQYNKRGTNFYKDTNGIAMTEKAAKEKIRDEERLKLGYMLGHRKAAEFGNKLYDQRTNTVATFEKFAAAEGYPVKLSPPFSATTGLEDTNFPPDFRSMALQLRRDAPILYKPIQGDYSIYLLALKTNVPGELPALDQIRDKVTTDYKRSQAMELARKEGNAFHTAVTNGLAQKKSFDDIAREAKVTPTTIPPFSGSTNSVPGLDERISFRTLASVAFELKPGEASQFLPAMEGGFLVYLKQKIGVGDDQVKSQLPDYLARLRAYRQNEAFNEWFRKEAEQGRLTAPKSWSEVSSRKGA